MNCTIAHSSPKSAFHVISSSNQTPKARPESVSFASHVAQTRISMGHPSRARPSASRIVAAAATAESPYQVLGIEERGSTLSDIKKAYKQMARKYHPDVSPPERLDEHTRRFIMVKQAYDTLSKSHDGSRNHRTESPSNEEWKLRWESQLDELKRKSRSSPSRTGRMSWGARMRTQA